ncbi:sodium ion-translocating decarboxylase subunit beta [candidate division WOR-3 bacterium]|nr:sodium ion-translocating decarboxylase subunit beta [candidate division WOR-3 bacterium]
MDSLIFIPGYKEAVMMLIGFFLIWVSVKKNYEPLLLLPIGIGIILVNLPVSPLRAEDSILALMFEKGVKNDIFPLLIFISIGAMMDFKPLVQRPWLVVFGVSGQIGIFATMTMAVLLGYNIQQAASIGIIGSADGPTSIFVSSKLAPELLGLITLAAYSYMALVPLIQPPIMKALTTRGERSVKMPVSTYVVGKTLEKLFPYLILLVSGVFCPMSVPLIGFLMFGNILNTSGVTDMLAKASKDYLSGLVTLFLGIAVGSSMTAQSFLKFDTLIIFFLGLFAFAFSTAFGVLLGKLMLLFKVRINPLIGAAGLSSFPMSARLVHQIGQEADRTNYLLMHAASANVSGQLASVIAGGVLIDLVVKYAPGADFTGSVFPIALKILSVGMGRVFFIMIIVSLVIYLTRFLFRQKNTQ